MIYASVCSGIEAPSVAWKTLPNWKAAWFSEIEQFPCAVLQHHYPETSNLGDMYGIRVDTNVNLIYNVNYGQTQEGISRGSNDVPVWSICSGCGGFLWSEPSSYVGVAEKTKRKATPSEAPGEEKPFSSRRGSPQQEGDRYSGKGNKEGDNATPSDLRGVRHHLCTCERTTSDRSSPRQLQSPAQRAVALSEMPLSMASEKSRNPTFIKTSDLDIIIGGFPCQDLSVAGKRSGLINEKGQATRSGLFYQIADLCDTIGQRWTLLENVPGLLSSKQGRDFAAVVGALSGAEISVPPGGWENAGFALGPKGLVEWAILDAQYFGVPQRRRRVFIIRDSGNWQDRPPLLLERHSLSGDTPPSRKKGERVAPSVTSGPPFSRTGNERVECEAMVFEVGPSGGKRSEVIPTLDARCKDGAIRNQIGPIVMAHGQGNAEIRRDGSPSLTCNHEAPIVAHTVACFKPNQGSKAGSIGFQIEQSPTLTKEHVEAVQFGSTVRRLLPVECEFLQGFPRDYTLVPFRGKPAADGPRYKALGNSMAVPVIRWIGERIEAVDKKANP